MILHLPSLSAAASSSSVSVCRSSVSFFSNFFCRYQPRCCITPPSAIHSFSRGSLHPLLIGETQPRARIDWSVGQVAIGERKKECREGAKCADARLYEGREEQETEIVLPMASVLKDGHDIIEQFRHVTLQYTDLCVCVCLCMCIKRRMFEFFNLYKIAWSIEIVEDLHGNNDRTTEALTYLLCRDYNFT